MNYRSRTLLVSASGQLCLFLILTLTILLSAHVALAQTTGFTYQGRLTDGGTPANGNYDLQFTLWDSMDGGAQIGSTQTVSTVAVSSGIFTVQLDFGANAFSGASRFLEISARLTGPGSFTLLSPRQQITSTPYAVRSLNAAAADTATNTTQLGGVAASQYVQTNDARLTDARSPTAGSSNYIQNTTSQQSAANFNISGNGTMGGTLSANVVDAATQYNIGGNRVLGVTGGFYSNSNTFTGVKAGASNVPGNDLHGNFNSFYGSAAGQLNTTGDQNTFFGAGAGAGNKTGSTNSFFGASAGVFNTTGGSNSFFGNYAGQLSASGDNNAFFGEFTGNNNTTGSNNTFIGSFADFNSSNQPGSGNTLLGFFAKVPPGVSNATAIGANASVTQSNSLILGSIKGVNFATADTKVGIGTTAPTSLLHVVGSQPPPVASGNGTDAASVLQVIGGKGGNSTGSSASGGAGASLSVQAGNGGDDFTTFGFGGNGGSITLTAGSGGGGSFGGCGGCPPGDGGSITLQAGNGASGSGGSISLKTGKGQGGLGAFGNVGIGMQPPPPGQLGGNALFIANETGDARNSFRIDVEKDNLYLIGRSDSGATADTGIIFRTAPAGGAGVAEFDRMAINGNGNIGIGTSSPASKLHVNVPSSASPISAMSIDVQSFQTISNALASHFFRVRDIGSGAPSAFFIRGDGNVGIGTESPSHKLEVNGSVAGVGPYQDISDMRFKKNISPLTGALNKVLRLRGVNFDWRQADFPAMNFSQGRQVGFIAQEVEPVLPEAVSKDGNGYYRMAYSEVMPVLVEAIKEQQAQIERQQAEAKQQHDQITALQAANAALSARLRAIEETLKKQASSRHRR